MDKSHVYSGNRLQNWKRKPLKNSPEKKSTTNPATPSEGSSHRFFEDLFSKFDPTTVNNSILDAARELCAEYLGGAWSTIDNTQIVLKKLSGGLTNLVFLCELSPDVVTLMCEPRSVLLRIQTQSDSLQLMREIAVFISLSAHGYGPNLLAVFPGGRIEEFIPSRTLTKEEYISERISKHYLEESVR
ncbi:hypothetical protein COOONC_14493 [Cooperia oncophora]